MVFFTLMALNLSDNHQCQFSGNGGRRTYIYNQFAQRGLLCTSYKSLLNVELACDGTISGRGGL
jgi:hypothetical protein